jgi:S1-C subfamily serine protease
MPISSRFAALLLCLYAGLAAAAEADWDPFATSASAIVFFDRGSVKKSDDYVQYRIRVDYTDERVSKDGKHRYRSAVNAFAAQCEPKKLVVTSVQLRDGTGARLMQSSRRRERWGDALKDVTPGGVEERLMLHACALASGQSPQPPAAKAGTAPARATTSIGSGIVASADGVIVTNHHVVDGCSRILVIDSEKRRAMAERIASDPKSDLALIRAKQTFTEVATFRKGVQLQAGESVTVVGYPLASILGSESNVAFGYVSATSGVRGDASRFQISAPVHKGNSGGPILDQSGNVTGIVNAKLNALAVQKRTGDLPQNISFGIKAEVAQLFLEANRVAHQTGAGRRKLENTEVAAIGRAITVLVSCRKEADPAANRAKGPGGAADVPAGGK